MALQNIIDQTKKKADTKAVCIELEEKIQELVEAKEEITDQHLMPPPSTVPRNKRSIRRSRRKSTSDEDEDNSDDSEEDTDNVFVIKCKFEVDLVNVFYIWFVCNYKYKYTHTILCYIIMHNRDNLNHKIKRLNKHLCARARARTHTHTHTHIWETHACMYNFLYLFIMYCINVLNVIIKV